MAKEQLRQLILDGFEEHVSSKAREIPLSEFEGSLPLVEKIRAAINFLWALTEVPSLKGPYPEVLVDPLRRTTVVIRKYPMGPGAIQYG